MSKEKDPAAQALGRKRGQQLTTEHQKAAAAKRWQDHVKCECGKCAACIRRKYPRKKK